MQMKNMTIPNFRDFFIFLIGLIIGIIIIHSASRLDFIFSGAVSMQGYAIQSSVEIFLFLLGFFMGKYINLKDILDEIKSKTMRGN